MIIDHEKSAAAGAPVPLDGTSANDETMALRVVTAEEAASAGPVPQVNYPELEEKVLSASRVEPKGQAWKTMRKAFHLRSVPGVTGRIPRAPFAGWSGPFPVRRADNMHGDPAPLDMETFARTAPIEDVVEAVKALSTEPEGVERTAVLDDDDHENTGTFALPAVWKLTGKKSGKAIAHRSAAHVQKIFNEAGWPIAVWYGEHTGTYWVMDDSGLHEFETVTDMYQGMGWEAL
ncbi:hypothetical protein SEA_ZUKO_34 [Streptomyces phage Zuko]|uniref:Uncharacterized protein n=1 Tax=Streptomyces phage Zuko TaxID=2601695 RepID=A0A5J6D6V5_9CAUD|nr:hypothetical protein PP630_gp034 [Streptomyces phage Zuko]QEQ93612.1 hypothetical protein SEA_ZUKO_34 [Streptomyces phage Zuko]